MVEYLVFTMDNCSFCDKAKALLTEENLEYREINVMDIPEFGAAPALVGQQTLPLVLKVIGGFEEINKILRG